MWKRASLLGFLLSICASLIPLNAYATKPIITFGNIDTGKSTAAEAARAYVSGLGQGFVIAKKNQSLLGNHYYFQQSYQGIPIEDAEVVVSVRDSDKRIYRVFNNAIPHIQSLTINDSKRITEQEAYDVAWKDLGVWGPLMSSPKIKLVYQKQDSRLNLVYQIRLAVAEPFGYWDYTVNATSGKILKKIDARITRKSKNGAQKMAPAKKGPLLERTREFAKFAMKLQNAVDETEGTLANGNAKVFDPDPRTTLNDNSLQDNSPAERFEGAYVTRELKDLRFLNNTYVLQGPWIQIKDFEPPTQAPSTTTNGNWDFKRGNNGFNDAMTYFHIDQNQRYIQSLGFLGEKGIQNLSISVDSHGVGGDDNSHFVPGENRIAFGHGCVDDNEDADVILHEYGHAIQDAISRNWHGGDTGAMGEGFGDYWATSYSLSTLNGSSFNTDNVFHWDAGGEGSPCWSGRRVNVEDALYDHSKNYQAHQPVGSFQSDELWSTPLVQSLKELISLGYPRENVDQIILEAHFGLGANLKMRDMANAIIQTAQRLYPNDPYASIFMKHFIKHRIVEVPSAKLELKRFDLGYTGNNMVLDPGETVHLTLSLANVGNLAARAVRARVSSTNSHVSLSSGDFEFGEILPGAEQINRMPISLALASAAPCGSPIDLVAEIFFEGSVTNSIRIPLRISVGVANIAGGVVEHKPGLSIPDNDSKGLTSALSLIDEGVIPSTGGLTVSIDIAHNYIGDLKVSLVSPSGKSVVLHNKSGSGSQNIVGTYPTTLTPADNLSKLAGESLKGEWILKAVDTASSDEGKLKKWGINVVRGYQCSAQ